MSCNLMQAYCFRFNFIFVTVIILSKMVFQSVFGAQSHSHTRIFCLSREALLVTGKTRIPTSPAAAVHLHTTDPGCVIACMFFARSNTHLFAKFRHFLYTDRRQLQLPVALHGCTGSFVTVLCFKTPSQSRIGRAMAFPRINCTL